MSSAAVVITALTCTTLWANPADDKLLLSEPTYRLASAMLKCKRRQPLLVYQIRGLCDKEFQTGIVLGTKLTLKVSVLAGNCLNFLEWIALDLVGAGVR